MACDVFFEARTTQILLISWLLARCGFRLRVVLILGGGCLWQNYLLVECRLLSLGRGQTATRKRRGFTPVAFCCSGRRRGQRPVRGLLAPHRPLASAEGKSLVRRPAFETQMRALHQNLPPSTFQMCGRAACKILPPPGNLDAIPQHLATGPPRLPQLSFPLYPSPFAD